MKRSTEKEITKLIVEYRYKADVLGDNVWWMTVEAPFGKKTDTRYKALCIFQTFHHLSEIYVDSIDKRETNILRGLKHYDAIEEDAFYIGGAVALIRELQNSLEMLSKIDRRIITSEMYKLTMKTVTSLDIQLEKAD